MPLSIDRFVEERARRWERLATLVRRGRSGVRALASEEVLELGRLYRAAASDLATAQRDYPADRATAALNALVGEAHALVYSEPSISARRLLDFARRDFPRLVRANAGFVVASFALFAIPFIAAYLIGLAYPALLESTLPRSVRDSLEHRQLWTDRVSEFRAFDASLIMTNNIRVSFLAFAGGAFAGTFTVFVLVLNGLVLGSVLAATQEAGLGTALLSFAAAHGFIELSVVFLAGAAGLRVASALLSPGDLSRRDALRLRGAQAVRIVLGCVPLLIVAGLIEAFLSPSTVPVALKIGVGLATGSALWAYLLLAGRRPA